MNNKGFIQIVTGLLLLASIYQLSFTGITKSVEKKAKAAAVSAYGNKSSADKATFERRYLDSMSQVEVYPGFGFTYQQCKENELNLGLDLQGGMNVTLEVETPAVIEAMAGTTTDQVYLAAFKRAKANFLGQENFVDALAREYNKEAPEGKIAGIFFGRGLENELPNGYNSSNDEVFDYLKKESSSAIDRTFEIISTRIDEFGVAQPNVQQLDNGRILVELPGVDNPQRVRDLLQRSAKLQFWNVFPNYKGYEYLEQVNRVVYGTKKLAEGDLNEASEAVETTLGAEEAPESEGIDGSLDGSLESNANDSLGNDSIEKSREEIIAENPVLSKVQLNLNQEGTNWNNSAMIGFMDEKDVAEFQAYFDRADVKAALPSNMKFAFGFKPIQGQGGELRALYALKGGRDLKPALEGDVITDARPSRQDNLNLAVSMQMNQEGTSAWRRITAAASSANPKECVAVVLDDKVYSAPTVQGEIPNGSSVITGGFDQAEASDLSNILKAGKLPAPAKIAGETTVGPTLGKEAIRSGLISLIVGFLLVIIFMVLYYGKAGLYADLALLVNLVFIIGVLAGMHAALTLPGMAGLVLTIGMAVDANVLIFERVREELQGGKSFKSAVKDGYSSAYSSILDANITTGIAAVILWALGKGPVMGFAVILFIGILSSLFTSIFLTRLLIDRDISKGKETSFYTSFSEKIGHKLNTINWDFIGKRKMFYMISGIIILGGIVSLATKGLSTGIDFKGGWSYVVNVEGSNSGDIKSALGTAFTDANTEVKTYGANNQYKITTSYNINSKEANAGEVVEKALISALSKYAVTDASILSSSKVGPTIAKDITVRSTWAIALAIIGMFLYILIRFRNVGFSLGATTAIFHDVLIVFSLYSILWGILPFELSIDQAFIAAILTVVGYSINDTVVVFDRVREFLGLNKHEKDLGPVINKAINTTLSRTLITSLTTLLVILILFIFGGEGLKGFTFALLVGVAVGTYSSVCIATPIVVDYMKRFGK
ncbi:protein translocase subunit SecDF [Bacteroidia bacterium]|nr:protein translocase subunit SecDF [Bacteroidia bacterium]MDB4107250.1 protein translocase subunit SecDF [Bacteroidia bacterium]